MKKKNSGFLIVLLSGLALALVPLWVFLFSTFGFVSSSLAMLQLEDPALVANHIQNFKTGALYVLPAAGLGMVLLMICLVWHLKNTENPMTSAQA